MSEPKKEQNIIKPIIGLVIIGILQIICRSNKNSSSVQQPVAPQYQAAPQQENQVAQQQEYLAPLPNYAAELPIVGSHLQLFINRYGQPVRMLAQDVYGFEYSLPDKEPVWLEVSVDANKISTTVSYIVRTYGFPPETLKEMILYLAKGHGMSDATVLFLRDRYLKDIYNPSPWNSNEREELITNPNGISYKLSSEVKHFEQNENKFTEIKFSINAKSLWTIRE